MKVIFLDFDGVLNSTDYFVRMHGEHGPGWQEEESASLDPAGVARVNEIVRRTDAVVVVSSAWRHGRYVADLRRILNSRGFSGKVIGKTPSFDMERGLEIQAWLNDGHDVESFVILDDDADMLHLLPRLVRTPHEHGIQDEHVDAAVALLSAPFGASRGAAGGGAS